MNKSFNCTANQNYLLDKLYSAKQLALSPSKEMDPVFGTVPGLLILLSLKDRESDVLNIPFYRYSEKNVFEDYKAMQLLEEEC